MVLNKLEEKIPSSEKETTRIKEEIEIQEDIVEQQRKEDEKK